MFSGEFQMDSTIVEVAPKGLCFHFQIGYCLMKGDCKLCHIIQVCQVHWCFRCNCDNLEFRHLWPCKDFLSFEICWFGTDCVYRYTAHPINFKFEEMQQSITRLEETVKTLVGLLSERHK